MNLTNNFKIIIKILNIISALPIIAYPVFFLTSIMAFDAPGSGKSWWAIATALALLLYPLFIGIFIFLSRKYRSIPFAVVACIPFFFFAYTLFIQDFISSRQSDEVVSEATSVSSKRVAAPIVKPVEFNGMRFEATGKLVPNSGSKVRATEISTGKVLWEKEIYTIKTDQNMEADVQDVNITELYIERNLLEVVNENNDRYELEPKTGQRYSSFPLKGGVMKSL